MQQDEKVVEDRAWYVASIERLMAVGVKLSPGSAKWLKGQRQTFYLNETVQPGPCLRDRMRRILVEAGMRKRRVPPRLMSERGVIAPEAPRASAPSGLQGSREPTPMGDWLRTGIGAPLRPPTRRAVGA